jgi:hypothetical protein
MNKTSVLMDVVEVITAEAQMQYYILDNEEYPLTAEEVYGIRCSIRTLERLAERLQEQIEADINAYEISQGM